MKYLWRCFFIGVIALMLSTAFATKHKNRAADSSDAHSACVYNYMSCRDGCEYYQDRNQIGPCKASCDRKYSCRPSASVKRPVDNTPNEPQQPM